MKGPNMPLYLNATMSGGMDLLDAFKDAHVLARKLGCGIAFTFSGQDVSILPEEHPQEQMDWYMKLWRDTEVFERDHETP
jgi:hypothetical protein